MPREHAYTVTVRWTGNTGTGTSAFRAYERRHDISVPGKTPIPSSSDPAFRGDKTRYNPEELLVASLSSCHMLWYLHLSAEAGIVVVEYEDDARGAMVETSDGGGHFTQVILHPRIKVRAGADPVLAQKLHEQAHHLCFIANSVNFPVTCEPTFEFE